MKLELHILSGSRTGSCIPLEESQNSFHPKVWIKEDEAIEIRIEAPIKYESATLAVYDHQIKSTKELYGTKFNTFIWSPKRTRHGKYENLFVNCFGLAELSIILCSDEQYDVVTFDSIDILASKAKADEVNNMISYLSLKIDNDLHALFQTTKYGSGYTSGSCSPNGNLDRIESTLTKLVNLIHDVLSKPITKLLPQQIVISPNGSENLDDSALGWLSTNLSVLESTDDLIGAHIEYEGNYYRASSIQVPVLKENTDIYENQVIHGFLEVLSKEAQKQLKRYNELGAKTDISPTEYPYGYCSFFSQISTLKKSLLGNQLKRCISITDRINAIIDFLRSKLPVSRVIIERPNLSRKAIVNYSYRAIFIEYIEWFEKSQPDWSAYQNLLAIQSVPKLFESYCYHRVRDAVSALLKGNGDKYHDSNNTTVSIIREPRYWMFRNRNAVSSVFFNSEGKTIRDGIVNTRDHYHKYSHRCPDIVLEVANNNRPTQLIILDAKYTSQKLAFSMYLKDCTMKYVHGIRSKTSKENPVVSMTIIFPDNKTIFDSFHSSDCDLLSNTPVRPSLQSVGLAMSSSSNESQFDTLIEALLDQAGVRTYEISDKLSMSQHDHLKVAS